MIFPLKSDSAGDLPHKRQLDDDGELEDFIYVLSHDVRSSVRALLELPQWIKEDLIEEGHKIEGSLASNFDMMHTHMNRLDQMLIDLLEYSRVGRKQSVKTNDLEAAVIHVLEVLNLSNRFSVTVELECCTIRMGDKDIFVLLKALISNAVKHHHNSKGHIQISSQLDGFDCVLRVRDDGPGIDENLRERVFDTMKTLKPRDEVEGSGMGLATVRKIVKFYDGQMRWVSGLNGVGLGLELRFPV